MKNIIPKRIITVLDVLKEAGYEAYLVGGCVRDFILDKEAKDFDITTNATVIEMLDIFKNFHVINNNGLKHNTVSIHFEDDIIEITSFRSEDYSIYGDLKKRDLAINAIAYNGDFVDPLNGIDDINNKIIRACSPTSFKEDYLRILRALRFSSILGFSIDEDTKRMIKEEYKGLETVSVERITKELCLILQGQNVLNVLEEFKEVFTFIIPELEPTIDFKQHNKWHLYDVYTHTTHVVNNAMDDYIVRVAALLHDIGKPNTFTMDEAGNGHFYGHPLESYHISKKILKRLRFSLKDTYDILYLILNHDDVPRSKKSIKRLLSKSPECSVDTFLKLINLQLADRKDHVNSVNDPDLDFITKTINEIIEEENCLSIKDLKVNGHDLMELGFYERRIKEVQETLLNLILDEKLENDKEVLIEYIKSNLI